MNKIKQLIKKLDLRQQLMCVILLVILIFSYFINNGLINNINGIVLRQASDYIINEQNTLDCFMNNDILDYYVNNSTNKYGHFIYNIKTKEYTPIKGDIIDINNIDQFALRQEYDHERFFLKNRKEVVILNSISNDEVLFTYTEDKFYENYINIINNSVIRLLLYMIIIIFFVLIAWFLYIIRPITRIYRYIRGYKGHNYDDNFDISRDDEIGLVATSIKELQQELLLQDSIKQEMIQNISHDLKTPISIIKSYGEGMIDGIYPYGTPEKSIEIILENANRLETKVYNLMLLNRIGYLYSENEVNIYTEMDLTLNKVADSLVLFRPNIKINKKINENIKFKGEEDSWRLVCENLLENGLRYAKTKIIVALRQDEFKVYNDGSHIHEDLIKRIFDPYQKGQTGNFGLGLSIVHKICDTYGYKIKVENLNEGVCFTITKQN